MPLVLTSWGRLSRLLRLAPSAFQYIPSRAHPAFAEPRLNTYPGKRQPHATASVLRASTARRTPRSNLSPALEAVSALQEAPGRNRVQEGHTRTPRSSPLRQSACHARRAAHAPLARSCLCSAFPEPSQPWKASSSARNALAARTSPGQMPRPAHLAILGSCALRARLLLCLARRAGDAACSHVGCVSV